MQGFVATGLLLSLLAGLATTIGSAVAFGLMAGMMVMIATLLGLR